MKRICFLVAVWAFLVCGCGKESPSEPNAILWPEVEKAVKAYAEQRGGTYHREGSWGKGAGTRMCNFHILIPCHEKPNDTVHRSVKELPEMVGGGSGGGGSYLFPAKEKGNSEFVWVAQKAMSAEWYGMITGGACMHVVGRIVVPRGEVAGHVEYRVLMPGEPTPEGALLWLKVDYINQNAPREKID